MTDSESLGHGMNNNFDFLISMPMTLPRMQVDSSMLAGGPLDLRSGAELWDTVKHPAMKLLFSHGSHGICLVCDQWMCAFRVRRLLRNWIVNSASCCQWRWLVWNHSSSSGLLILTEPPCLTDCVYNHECRILYICWCRLSGIGMYMIHFYQSMAFSDWYGGIAQQQLSFLLSGFSVWLQMRSSRANCQALWLEPKYANYIHAWNQHMHANIEKHATKWPTGQSTVSCLITVAVQRKLQYISTETRGLAWWVGWEDIYVLYIEAVNRGAKYTPKVPTTYIYIYSICHIDI